MPDGGYDVERMAGRSWKRQRVPRRECGGGKFVWVGVPEGRVKGTSQQVVEKIVEVQKGVEVPGTEYWISRRRWMRSPAARMVVERHVEACVDWMYPGRQQGAEPDDKITEVEVEKVSTGTASTTISRGYHRPLRRRHEIFSSGVNVASSEITSVIQIAELLVEKIVWSIVEVRNEGKRIVVVDGEKFVGAEKKVERTVRLECKRRSSPRLGDPSLRSKIATSSCPPPLLQRHPSPSPRTRFPYPFIPTCNLVKDFLPLRRHRHSPHPRPQRQYHPRHIPGPTSMSEWAMDCWKPGSAPNQHKSARAMQHPSNPDLYLLVNAQCSNPMDKLLRLINGWISATIATASSAGSRLICLTVIRLKYLALSGEADVKGQTSAALSTDGLLAPARFSLVVLISHNAGSLLSPFDPTTTLPTVYIPMPPIVRPRP
ncbi:hypothetical protein DFP72DRAFT_852345 [Ephemerocybe angulata]|uniref:Uncharacterized protein n=1 Tax=Ephemerocybe angulata TaxID=980116 RepID=A0A8H6HPZ4_9AGAR|nr:hypothetical protein DFP72DRAFT_852345 [Tulosesus angulatus]